MTDQITYRPGGAAHHLRGLPAIPVDAIRLMVIIGLGAAAGGFVVGYNPLYGLGFAGALIGVVACMLIGVRTFWLVLLFILFGYMFFSRGFASVGVYPLYIGEIGLAVGFLSLGVAIVLGQFRYYTLRHFLRWEVIVLLLFIIWNILQTVPYFGIYKFDSLRDAMLYGYALYAILVMLLIPRKWVEQFFRLYGAVIPVALLWFPVLFFISKSIPVPFPIKFPGSSIPLIYSKGSDTAVHLAAMGAYMLLGLEKRVGIWNRMSGWASWVFWAVSAMLLGAIGRGTLLSTGAGFSIAMLLRPRSRWHRPILLILFTVWPLLMTGVFFTVEINLGLHRNVSIAQYIANFESIFSDGDESGGLEGTKKWRLLWWEAILNYTFNGPYFWNGKGYGVNLANDDGFQVDGENEALRSPHNGHLTFLARSGVPGFGLWLLFIGGICLTLLTNVFRYRKTDPFSSKIAIWLLAYVVAHLILTSFDVYLEGPMGGVWFWSTVGMIFVYFSPVPHEPDAQPDWNHRLSSKEG